MVLHPTLLDMEYEEERGRGGKEEAKNQRSPDSCSERYRLSSLLLTELIPFDAQKQI